MGRVAVEGISLAAHEWPGSPSSARRPAIICIHGLTANHTCWASVADTLSPGFRVIAYDLRGRPMGISNLGASIGRGGLGAPGESVTSLGVNGPVTMGGTSAATPFVTGAVALTWSEFPTATAAAVRAAVIQAAAPRRTNIVPPLLNAWASYRVMSMVRG